MNTNTLPLIPLQAGLVDDRKFLTAAWTDYFNQLALRVGGNIAIPNFQLTDWTSSQSASGYQKLPSGLYVQWGVTSSLASNTQTVITFPVAFPTACFQVITGIQGNGAGATAATGQWGTSTYSKTGFTINNQTSASYTFNYFAVGN